MSLDTAEDLAAIEEVIRAVVSGKHEFRRAVTGARVRLKNGYELLGPGPATVFAR